MSGVSTQSSWRSFRVVRRETLSKGVTGFTLYPTDAGPVAPYLPGQGVSVRAWSSSIRAARSTSWNR